MFHRTLVFYLYDYKFEDIVNVVYLTSVSDWYYIRVKIKDFRLYPGVSYKKNTALLFDRKGQVCLPGKDKKIRQYRFVDKNWVVD